jgi:hypothetical protein
MGWREVLALHAECETLRTESDEMPVKLGARVLSMTADLRIAFARELLAGTGRVVARDVSTLDPAKDPMPHMTSGRDYGWRGCHADGWNACRAAMLEPDDAGG